MKTTMMIIQQYDIRDMWNFDIRSAAPFVLSEIVVNSLSK